MKKKIEKVEIDGVVYIATTRYRPVADYEKKIEKVQSIINLKIKSTLK